MFGLQAQAEKPAWQTGAKSSISLRKPAPLKLNGHAAPVVLDDDLIDEDDLLTEEDRLPPPAAGMLVPSETGLLTGCDSHQKLAGSPRTHLPL